MKQLMTIGLIRDGKRILLGLKKRGFGEGRWNGFGGKVEFSEDIGDALKREVLEESGLVVKNLREMGVINFYFQDKELQPEVHIFQIIDWEGEPMETEEMKPEWFLADKIPYNQMWPADKKWLEFFLSGHRFEGNIFFKDNNTVLRTEIRTKEDGQE